MLLSLSAFAQPDTLWTRTYGGNYYDYGKSVLQTTDGGYVIVGTKAVSIYDNDVWLIKTDDDGNETWTQTFGGSDYEAGYGVQQTSNGGYIIVGQTSSYGAGSADVWLIKTDANGDSIWIQTFGGSSNDIGRCIQQTTEGGYIITGKTSSFGAGGSDVYLIKTDANGNETWMQTFGGSNSEDGYGVQQTSDGGYVITGITSSFGAGGSDVYLIKTDANGNSMWTQTFGGSSNDIGRSVHQTTDGGYIVTGRTESYGSGSEDVWLIKTDAFGNESWTNTFGGSFDDEGESIQLTTDGGYIITGTTISFGAGFGAVYLIKTDANGDELWYQTFNRNSCDFGKCVQQTSDGGYIITGDTYAYGMGQSDVWLIKTDEEGTISPLTITLTPFNPPIQIPGSGGSFEFNVEVTNIGIEPLTFDIWTMVTLPDGSIYGPIIEVSDFTALPNWSTDRDRVQNVPESAPTGNYTYDAYAGIFPDSIWSEDHFGFVKYPGFVGGFFINNWDCRGEDFGNDCLISKIAANYALYPPSPNPFNPSTELTYSIQSSGDVTLDIFDITGKEVSTLIDGFQSAGSHNITWNAENFPSGIYFARLSSVNGQSQTQKLVLMK